jgi:acetylglutamate kinase
VRIVIKLGGEILSPSKRTEAIAIAHDVHACVKRGDTVVLVHGGGPQTTALQKSLGQEPNIVGGRRLTDEAALEAIKMAVGGKLNIEFCSVLHSVGVRAVGLNGVSGSTIQAVKRPPRIVSGCGDEPIDFGHVGDVTGINHEIIDLLVGAKYVPVLACIGADETGQLFNINADIVANSVAIALCADRLLLVTNAPGVLRDRHDPTTRIPTLTVSEGRQTILDGIVADGMIPKLEESFIALSKGVQQIQILGGLKPGDVLKSIDAPGAVGTTIIADH